MTSIRTDRSYARLSPDSGIDRSLKRAGDRDAEIHGGRSMTAERTSPPAALLTQDAAASPDSRRVRISDLVTHVTSRSGPYDRAIGAKSGAHNDPARMCGTVDAQLSADATGERLASCGSAGPVRSAVIVGLMILDGAVAIGPPRRSGEDVVQQSA